MPFPFNKVVLTALGDIDFLALLALTDTSRSLSRLIFDQVISMSSLCTFLREYQYVLQNDPYQLISRHQKVLLCKAFEVLRVCHGKTLYDNCFQWLGPLHGQITVTPGRWLGSRFLARLPTNGKQVPEWDTVEDLFQDMEFALSSPFMSEQIRIEPIHKEFDHLQEFSTSSASEDDPLFCRRYVDDIDACIRAGSPFSNFSLSGRRKTPSAIITRIKNIQHSFKMAGIHSHLLKKFLKAYMNFYLDSGFGDYPLGVLLTTFQNLFDLPDWIEMWDAAELGWWLAYGLSKFGGDSIGPLIQTLFQNKKQAALWLFLGAHEWMYVPLARLSNGDPEAIDRGRTRCCHPKSSGTTMEHHYVKSLVASLSKMERVWVIQQVVRLAPQYGECFDLGGNLYNWFVVQNLVESAVMLETLLHEITCSPLQYMFEHSIGLAISSGFSGKVEVSDGAKTYLPKLMRNNRELYTLLDN